MRGSGVPQQTQGDVRCAFRELRVLQRDVLNRPRCYFLDKDAKDSGDVVVTLFSAFLWGSLLMVQLK